MAKRLTLGVSRLEKTTGLPEVCCDLTAEGGGREVACIRVMSGGPGNASPGLKLISGRGILSAAEMVERSGLLPLPASLAMKVCSIQLEFILQELFL